MPRVALVLLVLPLLGCAPTHIERCTGESREVGLLTETPHGVPWLRWRELPSRLDAQLEWNARFRGLIAADPEPVALGPALDGHGTRATLALDLVDGPVSYAEVCDELEGRRAVLEFPVSFELSTDDGRVNMSSADGQALWQLDHWELHGRVDGMPIEGLRLPDCDPRETSFDLHLGDEAHRRVRLLVTCKADPQSEAYVPRPDERLFVPRASYELGALGTGRMP